MGKALDHIKQYQKDLKQHHDDLRARSKGNCIGENKDE